MKQTSERVVLEVDQSLSLNFEKLNYTETTRELMLARRPNEGLGFNIVGGEEGEQGIYVNYIVPQGVADLSGELKKGDQILFVNNIDLRGCNHSEATQILRNSGENVSIIVDQNPEMFRKFEATMKNLNNLRNLPSHPNSRQNSSNNILIRKNSYSNSNPTQHASQSSHQVLHQSDNNKNLQESSSLSTKQATPISLKSQPDSKSSIKSNQSDSIASRKIVKVLFDFNSNSDSQIPAKGMNLRFGDILLIINSDDDEWWRVKRLNAPIEESLVPSIMRLEAKCNTKYRSIHWRGRG